MWRGVRWGVLGGGSSSNEGVGGQLQEGSQGLVLVGLHLLSRALLVLVWVGGRLLPSGPCGRGCPRLRVL